MKKLKKGHLVEVLTGKDKGKTGTITSIVGDKCVVENLNEYTKALKPNQNSKGGLTKLSMPIHISNLALVVDKKKVKVGFKVSKDSKTRINKATGKAVD